jgi:ADP-heptose:LPS heptosyltransferase
MESLGEKDDRPVLLALRALKLGDLLVAVPAIHGLRRAFPDHALMLAMPGWLAPIVRLVGGVDALLPTPGLDEPLALPPGAVDIAVNLHGNGPESRGLIDALGAREVVQHARDDEHADPRQPVWLDGIHERHRWARLVRAFGIQASENDVLIDVPQASPVVAGAAVVHVGAFYGSRRWPEDRFARVAGALRDDGLAVVLTGSAAERARATAVARAAGLDDDTVLAGRTDLEQLAAVIASARIVVSGDTGAAHLASAYAVPSVVLFGPAPPEEWGPPPGPHIVLTDPSLRRGETFSDIPDPALLAVGSDAVIEAAHSLLSCSQAAADGS